jgi:hypothetical protein
MMLSQVCVKRFSASFCEQRLKHHVAAMTFREMVAVSFAKCLTRVLPCFLSMWPLLSRCLPFKPFLAIVLSHYDAVAELYRGYDGTDKSRTKTRRGDPGAVFGRRCGSA